MEHPIATLALQARRSANSEEFPVSVSVGAPYRRPNGSWGCPLELTGLHGRLADVVGEDSFQALCLAIVLAGNLLRAFVDGGGRLRSLGDDPEDLFPLEAYFGASGPSSAEGAA